MFCREESLVNHGFMRVKEAIDTAARCAALYSLLRQARHPMIASAPGNEKRFYESAWQ